MNKAQLISLGLAAAIISAGLTHIATVIAQKAERGTQHWAVRVPDNGMGQWIHVYDMSGTCVYAYEGYNGIGGIAVISKATLPMGAGCQ